MEAGVLKRQCYKEVGRIFCTLNGKEEIPPTNVSNDAENDSAQDAILPCHEILISLV